MIMKAIKTLVTLEMTQEEYNAVDKFLEIIGNTQDLFPDNVYLDDLLSDFTSKNPTHYRVKIVKGVDKC